MAALDDMTVRELLITYARWWEGSRAEEAAILARVNRFMDEHADLKAMVLGTSIEADDLEGSAKEILLKIAAGNTEAAQYEDGSGVVKATMDQRIRACEAILGDDIRAINFTYTGPKP